MKNGFTLVELSIVLVIIGLLIGGILVGQSLVESAKINKVISEVQQYTIPINLFKQRFRYLPGDYPNASTAFGGTTYSGNDTDGDGNGVVDNGASGHEFMRVWEHISKAGLIEKDYAAHDHWQCYNIACQPVSSISDVDDSSLSSSNDTEGYRFEYYSTYPPQGSYGGGTNENNPGHYFELRRSGYDNDLEMGTVTPVMAMAIDGKVDDGLPQSGDVRGHNPSHFDPTPSASFQPCREGTIPSKYMHEHDDDYGDGCIIFIKAEIY